MQVTVGGQAVKIRPGSLDISDAIEERSTASLVVVDVAGTLSFRRGQPVRVVDDGGAVAFAGFVDTAEMRPAGLGGGRLHTIRAVDNHYLADKRVAARSYENTLAGDIVKDLITQYLAAEGVTGDATTIWDGPMIEQAVINYRPVSEALDKLAELADYHWWIDAQRVLHFAPRDAYPAPWELTDADVRRDSAVVQEGNPQYRNQQYILGPTDITDPQVETCVADGQQRSFAVGFPIAKVPTIEISTDGGAMWQAQTVGIGGVDSGMQWYWNEGRNTVTQDQSQPVLAAGTLVRITYQGQIDIVAVSGDLAAQEERKQLEGGTTSGIVEAVDDDPDLNSRDAAFQRANALLQRYGVVGRTLRFRTRRGGLQPGQLLTVHLPDLGLDGVPMLITSIETSDEDTVLWRDVTAVEGSAAGSWVKLFKTMATRGRTFVPKVNIGEERVLTVLVPSSDAWPWTESVVENVYACPVPSASLYPSASLFPC